jgi:PAS domain S-box-containing protein
METGTQSFLSKLAADLAGPSGRSTAAPEAERQAAGGASAGAHGLRSLAATFRRIHVVVFLIFLVAVVQVMTLWAVCTVGMTTAASLEHQGLPALSELASLQEHLAVYRLNSYEYLFAHEEQRAAQARQVEADAAQMRIELRDLGELVPDADGRGLVTALGTAVDSLDAEFRKVRSLVDPDFAAAMEAMDREIPARTARVAAAAGALKSYCYRFSGRQANATFGSFGWIRKNAVMFGLGNIAVAFGAVVFIRLAASRSRAQLSQTLARLDERTQQVAGSLSVLHATLESTIDGILVVDLAGALTACNGRFAELWGLERAALESRTPPELFAAVAAPLTEPERFADQRRQADANPDRETSGVLEFKDGRCFESYSRPQRIAERIAGRVWCFRDVTARRQAELKLADTHRQLLASSRQAGMAEVATGVLHNVGNVLNSVNVSATLVAEHVQHSKAANIAKLAALFEEHQADLGAFLRDDPRGRMIPGYLASLRDSLAAERSAVTEELEQLRKNVEHIKDIVAMQQSYAKTSGFLETVALVDLVDDALRLNATSLARHEVDLVRDVQISPEITTDKHKVLQILVNLLRNAKHACSDSGRPDKRIGLRIDGGGERVRISVSDNGVGIAAENLARIFNHGFTTRKGGHGFGLHSGALAARQLGGSLAVQSDGPGRGATFILELPRQLESTSHEHSGR